MRSVTIVWRDGERHDWKCVSSSWGDQSRNVILRNVSEKDGEALRGIDYVLVPLEGVAEVIDREG